MLKRERGISKIGFLLMLIVVGLMLYLIPMGVVSQKNCPATNCDCVCDSGSCVCASTDGTDGSGGTKKGKTKNK